MNNLNEVWHFDDETDRWAAERELELRSARYQRWLEGGLVGAVNRVTRSMQALSSQLAGDPERTR